MNRRTIFKGTAAALAAAIAVPAVTIASDQRITNLVEQWIRLEDQLLALDTGGIDLDRHPRGAELFAQQREIEAWLATTPATGPQGLGAKVEWLRLETNFNDGDLSPDHINGAILLSLFADIERLEMVS